MPSKERVLPSPNAVFAAIDQNLPKNLPPFRNLDPKDRTREMQKAAFGDNAVEVTDTEYEELIDIVRNLRPHLRQKGKTKDEHPSFKGTDHEIFWLADIEPDDVHSVSFEPRPWEQAAGMYREPYPKFSAGLEDATKTIDFSIDFDDTYNLTIKNKKTQVTFEASGLQRKHMTANEYKVVKYAIKTITSYFDIPLVLAGV